MLVKVQFPDSIFLLIITLFTKQKNLYDSHVALFTLQWITLASEILTAKLEQIAKIRKKKKKKKKKS